METEVKQESCTYETITNIKFVNVSEVSKEESLSSPKNRIEERNSDPANVQVKSELPDYGEDIHIFFEFEEEYRRERCDLNFEEPNHLSNHYRHPNKDPLEANTKEVEEDDWTEKIRIIYESEEKFRCEYCSLEFEEASDLTSHRTHCSNKEQEPAGQQNVETEEEEDCSNEICVSFDPEFTYKCSRCGLTFDEATPLRTHFKSCRKKVQPLPPEPDIIEEREGGILVCNFCKLQIIDKEFYPRHREKCKKKYSQLNKAADFRKRYKCNICNFAGRRIQDLEKHIFVHSDKKDFSCEVCGRLYKHKESLKYHMKAHDGVIQKKIKTKRFKCDKCEYTATDTYKLNVHMTAQHTDKVKPYQCINCKFATHYKEHLRSHMRTHLKERPFKCTYKSRECTLEESGECKICESGNDHMCEYAANQKFSLNMHILSYHSDAVKRYKCTSCEYATHFRGHLNNHLHRHSTDKPFKCTYKKCKCTEKESCDCDMCDFATAYKYCLMSHVRQCHTKEKIYPCKECPYATANSSNLKLHIRRKHT